MTLSPVVYLLDNERDAGKPALFVEHLAGRNQPPEGDKWPTTDALSR
jgi:hypothetical protein